MRHATIDGELEKSSYAAITEQIDKELMDQDGSTSEVAPWSHTVSMELANLKSLKDNWDGFGGLAPSSESLRAVEGLLNFIARKKVKVAPPYIDVGPNGCVVLQWEADLFSLDLEITHPEEIPFLYRDRKKPDVIGVLQHFQAPGDFLDLLDSFPSI